METQNENLTAALNDLNETHEVTTFSISVIFLFVIILCVLQGFCVFFMFI